MRRRPPVAIAEAIAARRTGVPTVDQDSRIFPPPKESPVSRHTLAVALLALGIACFIVAAAVSWDDGLHEVALGYVGFAFATGALFVERVK